MDQPDQIDPTVLLEGLAGTYLRNPRRDSGTCSICCAPANPGYETCYDCGFTWRGRLPDLVGFCIYGAQGTQAGQLLHGYKASPPAREHLVVMSLLVQRALVNHAHCPEALVGRRVTHWAVVPSTRGRGSSHPSGPWWQVAASSPRRHWFTIHVFNRSASKLCPGCSVPPRLSAEGVVSRPVG